MIKTTDEVYTPLIQQYKEKISDLQLRKIEGGLGDERKSAAIDARAREDIIKMRKCWSYVVLSCIGLIVVLDFLIVFLLGFKVISFKEGYLIPIFITDSILEVFGLAYVVVKFLFNIDFFKKNIKR